jgi:asparagine synthase (glutamine-hydrolysing)
MCGITGFVSDISDKEDVVRSITDLLHHRGPDDSGYFVDGDIALGHRRLSIIDLSGGKQPMEDEKYVIVFNGEIYNYATLKKALVSKGYSFKTSSDTEVLLKMFAEYGEKSLELLNGMFVFAIWDKVEKKLFIARDRLGIKPLYYANVNGSFVFASEVKSILAFPGFEKELNKKVISSYFQYRYILGEETLFKGIKSLLPGYHLFLENDSPRIEKYWELPVATSKNHMSEEECIEKCRSLVTDSVKRRMVSDVPIGAYLSGGLDSSIVAALMAQFDDEKKLNTFTIGFKEKEFNEFEYARLVADRYGIDHHEILLNPDDYFETMDYLIGVKDAPLAVPNEVPLYLMSKYLKDYITVVLSGEGADELFCGYGRIFISYLDFERSGKNDYLKFFLDRYNYVSDSDLGKFLNVEKSDYTQNIFQDYFDKVADLDIKDKIPYVFQNLHLQGLLQRVDNATMAASVEGRVPFVDHELIEFVSSIPFDQKLKWKDAEAEEFATDNNLSPAEISETYDIPKYLLRKAFEKDLPQEVVKRKKVGFPVPLSKWFGGDFGNYAKKILLDEKTLNRGIFNVDYLKSGNFIDELSGINIWMMINFELFLRKYFD